MAAGARALLALQVGARLLTFALNQILVRTTTPAVFGAANVQLELVLSTVLSLSRDGVRAVVMRHQHTLRTKEAPQARMLHNLVLALVVLGGLLAACVGWAYTTYLAPAALWAQSGAAVPMSVVLYCTGAWLELLAEPLHTYALGLDQYVSIRVAMEAGGVFARAIVNVALLQPVCLAWMRRVLAPHVVLPETPMPYALLSFACARLAYGLAVWLVAVFSMARVRTLGEVARILWPVRADAADAETMALLRVTTGQAVLKLVLTEGDKLAMARWTPLEDQGGYALASNYGSLVARTVFQPLEESARLRFSRCRERVDPGAAAAVADVGKAWADAASFVGALLRVYVLFSAGLVALAPPVARPFLHIVAGRRWVAPGAPAASILACYCWYVPIMGVNGLVEAFLQSVAPPHILRRYSGVLVGSSAVLVGVLGVHTYVEDVTAWLGWRAESTIVLASMASLAIRAGVCAAYMHRVCVARGLHGCVSWRAVLPRPAVLAMLAACGAILRANATLPTFAGCTLLSLLAVAWGERDTCLQALRVIR